MIFQKPQLLSKPKMLAIRNKKQKNAKPCNFDNFPNPAVFTT